MTSRIRFVLLQACFFLSGLAALAYQTAWTRQFEFVFGTSSLAIATVLASYMGGLAAGAAAAARLLRWVRRPVLLYGALELGIAAAALFMVPAGIGWARELYATVFSAPEALGTGSGLSRALFYAACSFLIVLVPTALMGATLPLLARHAVRSDRELGRRVGSLYAINTAGAIAGAILAGFLLVPELGLQRTIRGAAALNVVIFLAAAGLSWRAPSAAPETSTPVARKRLHWILPLMLLAGSVSFTYEVLWTRLLGHLLGGSTYAFSTMLASFLTGISLGSWGASRFADSPERALRGFVAAELGAAVLSLVAFHALDWMPGLASWLGTRGVSRLAADAVVAGSTLLPSALCMGATFPLAVRIVARGVSDAAPASARVYAWNTVGAIVGAFGAGFFLIPGLGFEGTLAAAVVVNLGLAGVAALLLPGRARGWIAATLCGLALLLLFRPGPPWNLLQTSPLGGSRASGRLVHFGVGRSATVLMLEQSGSWLLRSNGLPESMIQPRGGRAARFPVSRWLGALGTLARPEAHTMMVVGFGGGLTVESVPPSLERIDVVELEPEIVEANRRLAGQRRNDPLSDPRVHVTLDDARGALLLTDTRYDVIVSQPSHPWTTGASHLYTQEFFELVREHLSPDGVFVQWIGLNFVDEPTLRSLVATLLGAFSDVHVYRPATMGILFLASDAPLDVRTTAPVAISEAPDHYADLGLLTTADLLAAQVLDSRGSRRFAEGAAPNRDDHNRLLTLEPRNRPGHRALEPDPLFASEDPLNPVPQGLDGVRLVRSLLARGQRLRAERLAEFLEVPVEREVALALMALSAQQRGAALSHIDRAIELDPSSAALGYALDVAPRRPRGEEDRTRAVLLRSLGELGLTLDEASRAARREDWAAVRALDRQLEGASAGSPGFAQAVRLRAGWRLETGDEALAHEALTLIDRALVLGTTPEDLIVRAQAAALAGLHRAALATLTEAAGGLRTAPARGPLARRALDVLRSLPPRLMGPRERKQLQALFEAQRR